MKIRLKLASKIRKSDLRNSKFPDVKDGRSSSGLIFPSIRPSFKLIKGSKILTMGSCFARNIEEFIEKDFIVPAMDFKAPEEEYKGRSNRILNEYNPGTMSQRLLWAAEGLDTSKIDGYIGDDSSFSDLLVNGKIKVTKERLLQRRKDIDSVYSHLNSSSVMIITLGLVECFYDNENDLFLNNMPSPKLSKKFPRRFSLRVLNVANSFNLLSKSFKAAFDVGLEKILLTVSPVPMQVTFTGDDCVIANQYSKAVLRVVANKLKEEFKDKIDYFPSFEIVTSGGLSSFENDQVHVKNEVVEQVVKHLKENYIIE